MRNPVAKSIPVKADFKWAAGKRREFVRARLIQDSDAQTVAQIYHHQGSGVLASTTWSDGLIMIPEGVSIEPGERVDYTAFSSLLA